MNSIKKWILSSLILTLLSSTLLIAVDPVIPGAKVWLRSDSFTSVLKSKTDWNPYTLQNITVEYYLNSLSNIGMDKGEWTGETSSVVSLSKGLNFHKHVTFAGNFLNKSAYKLNATDVSFYSVQKLSSPSKIALFDENLPNFGTNTRVRLYDEPTKKDYYISLNGTTNSFDSRSFNDRASYIEVATGYKAEIFWDIDLGGTSKTFTGDTTIKATGFDNEASSIRVTRTMAETTNYFPTKDIITSPLIAYQNLGFNTYQYNLHIGGFTGDFYEFIATTDNTPDTTQKIYTYLSLKYGLTYAKSYKSSSGVEMYPLDTNYNHNIFGLARDDVYKLHQRVATSVLEDYPLVISTKDDFTNLNEDINRPKLEDKKSLVLGDNGIAISNINYNNLIINNVTYKSYSDTVWKGVNKGIKSVYMNFKGVFDDKWGILVCTDGKFNNTGTQYFKLNNKGTIDLNVSSYTTFYFKLASESENGLQSIIEIPKDDQGTPLFSSDYVGVADLLPYQSSKNIFVVNQSYTDKAYGVDVFPTQSYESSTNPNIRYAVSKIIVETAGVSEPTYCIGTSNPCEKMKFDITGQTKVSYIWSAQHRLDIETSSPLASSEAILIVTTKYKDKVTGKEVNINTSLSGVGTYWINDGDKVELRTKTSGVQNLIVNGLSFTDSNNIPVSQQIVSKNIDGTEYYTNTLTDSMRSYNSGKVKWEYGTKIHQFENVLGEPFSLDKATPYTGSIESRMETKEQVKDNVLSAIQALGGNYKPMSFLPNSSDTPAGSTEINAMIYDTKNPDITFTVASDNQNIVDYNKSRDIFKGQIYFTRPGTYRLEWMLQGDDFPVGNNGSAKLVVEVHVKWPLNADYHHIAETPPVSLDNSKTDDFFYKELRLVQKVGLLSSVEGVSVNIDNAFTFPHWEDVSKSSIYRSVLFFTKSKDKNTTAVGDISKEDIVIKVVESRHWSNGNTEKDINIGEEITDSEHNLSVGHNGYMMQTDKLKNPRYNITTYNNDTMIGEIFAVNTEQSNNGFANDGEDDIVVAWYQYFPEGKLAWANKTVRYIPEWKYTNDRIVIASRLGTDGLDANETNRTRQLKFDPELYSDLAIYNQPNRDMKGYNPNEEHALIAPSYFYGSPKPNAVYALRNDLNNPRGIYTSHPAVLVQYKDIKTGKYRMKVYKVVSEDNTTIDHHNSYIMDRDGNGSIDNEENNSSFRYTFNYPIYVGDKVKAPYPLDMVIGANMINESRGENSYGINAYWEDKNTNSWVVAGDTKFDAYFWYPMLSSFWHPTAKTGDIIPFTAKSLMNYGLWKVSKYQSLYFISNGIASSYSRFDSEFKVVYSSYWKPNIPEIRLGETVTFEGGEEKKDNPKALGLPSVVAWASAEILYDEMNKDSNVSKWTDSQNFSVRLQPAVRKIEVDISAFPTELYPATKRTTNKGGLWFFEELHAGLKQRVYFDQKANKIVLRGLLNEKFAGDSTLTKYPGNLNYILQPNILSRDDINTLLSIEKADDKLKTAFIQLYALSMNPSLTTAELNTITSYTPADIDKLSSNYTVGVSRFLRDKNNKFLQVKEIVGSYGLSDEMRDNLPNGKLPIGLSLDDIEKVDKSSLPHGVTIAPADIIDNTSLVRIKKDRAYIPASQLGTGLALFTNPSLANPNSDFNSSHIVIVENNDPAIKGNPILIHTLKVNNRPYRGQIKTVLSDNVFDEKITLRHTGDFGGNTKDLIFQWFYRESSTLDTLPNEPLYKDPSCPNGVIPTLSKSDEWKTFVGKTNEVVFGRVPGAVVLTDNDVYVRYRHKEDTKWSGWAGAGGNNPCNTPAPVFSPQLIKGWVKRVTDGVNVYDTRINDFSKDAPATYVSMIEQIGQNYVGDVALNADKNVIENVGLAALYDTVLNRAKNLSIDAAEPSSSEGVVQALQNAASRISQFYTLLGNEAYADALDPTIGYKTSDGKYGNLAPTIFTFMNQVGTLAEEELVLLRGTAGKQEGDTGAAPVHNRFLWNFTNGDGEAAYALSYDIKDKDNSGKVDYNDAKIMYPQGHGDAWGHYLTALQTYYNLLSHEHFNWVSRAEKYEIDGITLNVDYLDERRFAEAAAYKSKVGAETVALTYRQKYEEAPEAQWQGYKDTEAYRAWGVDGWIKRSHIGAYYDWITANAILPQDSNLTGIQKIDRTTIGELQDISVNGNAILTKLAQINAGQNPLGLLPDAVPFDIDPTSSESQFEQVYARAEEAVKNAKNVFDYANELKHRIRQVADSQQEFSEQVDKQDIEYRNRLIEIFGTPYAGIIGAGKAYPEGYRGPDINYYQYVDVAEVNNETLPKQDTTSSLAVYVKNLGQTKIVADKNASSTISLFAKYYKGDMPPGYNRSMTTELETEKLNYPLTKGSYMFQALPEWGKRETSGSLQIALTEILKADVAVRLAAKAFTGLSDDYERLVGQIKIKQDLHEAAIRVVKENEKTVIDNNLYKRRLEATKSAIDITVETVTDVGNAVVEGFPKVLGTSNDGAAAIRMSLLAAGSYTKAAINSSKSAIDAEISSSETDKEVETLRHEKITINAQTDADIKELLLEIDAILDSEPELRLALFSAKESVRQATQKYTQILGKGLRLLEEREAFNKRVAAKTHGKRYQDMAFRLNRTEASQKYRETFDLAAKYLYLAAKAYDYETNLSPKHVASAQHILADIVRARSLGELTVDINGVQPVVGQGGLADIMARLKANYKVLKTQMGINNPQLAEEAFSLRRELFRISDDNNESWEKTLAKHYKKNIWDIPEFRTQMRPFASESEGEQPGIVIEFNSNIISGLNFFGFPLSANDHAYDASQYATKIKSIGISFENYQGLGLAATSRAYLVPVGQDVMLVPDSNELDSREWNVKDQKIPVPLPFGKSDMEDSSWMPLHSLDGEEGQVRRHSRIRVYNDLGTVDASKMQKDSRLYGRSVWNTRWLLIIPGESLLNPAENGIQTLIHGARIPGSFERDGHGISDIKLSFETYSYSGN